MTVTREMIGAAHDICLKKGDFVLSADLLERIYLAMREHDETFDNGPMGEEVNDILRAKLAEAERERDEALAKIEAAGKQEPVAWLIDLHGPAFVTLSKGDAELEFKRRQRLYPDGNRRLINLVQAPPIDAAMPSTSHDKEGK